MQRTIITVGAALLLLLLGTLPASANSAPPRYSGDQTGVLMPGEERRIRVDTEHLTFDLAAGLASARVEAVYEMTNTTTEMVQTELAFVSLSGGAMPGSRNPTVTVDGHRSDFRVLTDHDLFAPLVQDWLTERPAIKAVLAQIAAQPSYGAADVAQLAAALTAAGHPLLDPDLHRLIDLSVHPEYGAMGVAQLLMPDLVQQMTQGWSLSRGPDLPWLDPISGEQTEMHFYGGRAMQWLLFAVTFEPGATRTVAVAYDHMPSVDRQAYVHNVYQYEYLLSPARSWGAFGPLSIEVRLPEQAYLHATIPLTRDGQTYRADLPGLPDTELFFAVMSQQGVIFGLTDPIAYWRLLLGLLLLLALPLGWLLGRGWGALAGRMSKPAAQRAMAFLLCLLGSGIGGVVIHAGVVALVWWLWAGPMPTGGGAILGAIAQVGLATIVTVIASAVAAMRALGGQGV